MQVTLNDINKILNENNNFYILTHKSPDGDTLGSAFALCLALQKLGKNARILCSDEIPKKYRLLYENIKKQCFEPEYIISVDVADTQLLGESLAVFADKIDLCIDHHPSNALFSKFWYNESTSASTAEIIFEIIKNLNVEIDINIANCIYTGISTDTGGFRHSNTTSRAHKIAAELIEIGAKTFEIDKIMFDTKSLAKLNLEKVALESTEFFCDNQCAMISISNKEIKKSGACEGDFDGISAIPRQIEGIIVGIFIKEKMPGIFKISVRTDKLIDASKICAKFGGGGHKCAAGCTILGDFVEVKSKIIAAVERCFFEKNERNNNFK